MKYEEVYLKAYAYAGEAKRKLEANFRVYNEQRPQQLLGYRFLAEVFYDAPALLEEGSEERRSSPESMLLL